MKRLISILLVSLMMLTALTACGGSSAASLTLGLGVYTSVSATDATEDKDGQGQATITAAAVLVDNDGKIVKAFIDVADNKVTYTASGKAVAVEAFSTKYEQGPDYNMVAYGGAVKEWFEQAAAFDAACLGKTASEITAMMGEDAKGNADLQAAGCTIAISGFVKAATKIG